jgi:hypothetical protein
MAELFVPVYPNGDFAVGGGSSTPSHVRAFKEKISAQRSADRLRDYEYKWDETKGRYVQKTLGTSKVVRFISEDSVDAVKMRINNVLVMYAVEPALYREIIAAIKDELG